eukprot:gene21106-23169_t
MDRSDLHLKTGEGCIPVKKAKRDGKRQCPHCKESVGIRAKTCGHCLMTIKKKEKDWAKITENSPKDGSYVKDKLFNRMDQLSTVPGWTGIVFLVHDNVAKNGQKRIYTHSYSTRGAEDTQVAKEGSGEDPPTPSSLPSSSSSSSFSSNAPSVSDPLSTPTPLEPSHPTIPISSSSSHIEPMPDSTPQSTTHTKETVSLPLPSENSLFVGNSANSMNVLTSTRVATSKQSSNDPPNFPLTSHHSSLSSQAQPTSSFTILSSAIDPALSTSPNTNSHDSNLFLSTSQVNQPSSFAVTMSSSTPAVSTTLPGQIIELGGKKFLLCRTLTNNNNNDNKIGTKEKEKI